MAMYPFVWICFFGVGEVGRIGVWRTSDSDLERDGVDAGGVLPCHLRGESNQGEPDAERVPAVSGSAEEERGREWNTGSDIRGRSVGKECGGRVGGREAREKR